MSKKRPRPASHVRPPPTAAGRSPAPSGVGRPGGFFPDYSHILRDLKRLGLLAGVFILLLLIGTLFVR